MSIVELNKTKAELEGRLEAIESTLALLVEVLVGKGVMVENHKRLIEKAAERAKRKHDQRVHLRVFTGDKYEIPGPDIDCASLLHLCRARCCSMRPRMSRQDLEEGKIEWELEDPYIVKRANDSYCHYLADSGGCGIYDIRPAACREFDCRNDPRIWADWDNKVPADYGVVREYPEPE